MLVAAAFVVVRGPLDRLLARPFIPGITFGIFAASEAIFPSARFPYATHTLICGFATAYLGIEVGAIAGLIACVAAGLLLTPANAILFSGQLGVLICTAYGFRRLPVRRNIATFASVLVGQAISVAVGERSFTDLPSLNSPWTIIANPFGALLLGLVLRDASIRTKSILRQREIEEARTRAVELRLLTLRGRVHPHFLYNALTSIAALCQISPRRASQAAINLGGLMRKSLEDGFGEYRSLGEEMETVRIYSAVEQERFGEKLCMEFHVVGYEQLPVPPFGIQILLENAILHGVSKKAGGGTATVFARTTRDFGFVVVADDGVGLPKSSWRNENPHGLTILEGMLRAPSLAGSRLKLVKKSTGGTIAVLRVPRYAK